MEAQGLEPNRLAHGQEHATEKGTKGRGVVKW